MATNYNPRTITDGLILNYDFGNFQKAFGTTNLSSNTGLSIYNNVPSHVTATLTQTSETYKQSPVWALTLTPTTSTGVSYLTSANNPGIGVLTGGGGGTGGVYTGHSIFFKSSVPLYGPAPIYTQYSNIGGWQSTGNYDDMGDGWYRANVIWYDTVTRSDGKYWAINPASATLNVPMTIYWAAPFKESQNYSSFVSPYTSNTRGSGSGVVNLVSQSDTGGTLTNGPTYSSTNLEFDGVDDYVTTANTTISGSQTFSVWAMVTGGPNAPAGILTQHNYTSTANFGINHVGGNKLAPSIGYTNGTREFDAKVTNFTITNNVIFNAILVYNSSENKIYWYINGQLDSSYTLSATPNSTNYPICLGRWDAGYNSYYFNGRVYSGNIHNKALSAEEVKQNFNANRFRYGL
jgi:hypothetical protein